MTNNTLRALSLKATEFDSDSPKPKASVWGRVCSDPLNERRSQEPSSNWAEAAEAPRVAGAEAGAEVGEKLCFWNLDLYLRSGA